MNHGNYALILHIELNFWCGMIRDHAGHQIHSREQIFGKEKYVVLAYYNEPKSDGIIVGIYDDNKDAINTLLSLSEYRNIFGNSVFSGGKVLAVPEKPILKDSPYWTVHETLYLKGYDIKKEGGESNANI